MSWRLALRLARREVVRRPGRAALVTLLVAIPVCGMTLATVLFRSQELTPAQQFRHAYHGADAALSHPGAADLSGPTYPAEILPAGAQTLDVRTAPVFLEGPDLRRAWARATDAPLEHPGFTSTYRLLDGRAPRKPGEVALTSRSARQVRAGIGDEVTISADHSYFAPSELAAGDPVEGSSDQDDPAPGEPRRVTVVGLVEDGTDLSHTTAVVHTDQSLPAPGEDVVSLVALPDGLTGEAVPALVEAGFEVAPHLAHLAPSGPSTYDSTSPVRWALVIGAVALTAAGIVISAAFAVGARRQLTTLGQLSATGASPALLRRTLALQGTLSGVVGLVVGWALTAAILGLGRDRIELLLNERLPIWDLHGSDLVAISLIGVAAATIAALVPARTAARIPTLAALAGRRPLSPVPASLTASGLVAIVAGLGLTALAILGAKSGRDVQVWALVPIVGGVLQLLGACAVTPMLASRLEPVAARLRGPWRLGARSLARNRTRTGAVVAAVAAAGAIAVFASGMVRSYEAREARSRWYELPDDVTLVAAAPTSVPGGMAWGDGVLPNESVPVDDEALTRVESIVPGARRVPVRQVTEDDDRKPWHILLPGQARSPDWAEPEGPLVADEALLDVLDAPGGLRDQLADEGLVWLSGLGSDEGYESATLLLPDGTEHGAAVHEGRDFRTSFGSLLVSPELADSLGLTVEQSAVAFQAPAPLADDQRAQLSGLTGYTVDDDTPQAATPDAYLHLQVGSSSSEITDYPIEVLLSGVALVIALVVTGISLALTASESRDEREVLTVMGARPRDLARSAGSRAGLLAVLGAAVAVPLGLAQLTVVSWTAEGFPIRPPWLALTLLLAIPLVAALTARTASAIAQRARPVRISTATFE